MEKIAKKLSRDDKVLNKILGFEEEKQKETIIVSDKMEGGVLHIAIGQITPNPSQPRRIFNEEKLQALSESISTEGLLQPIVVRIVSSSPPKYEIIAGERRLKAAKIAGLSTIPAIVRNAESRDMRRLALTENMQRVDLNIVEKIRVIGEMMKDFHNTSMVADEVGLSRRMVERYVRIYRVIYNSEMYGSEIFTSIFESHSENIDFQTAETMAVICELIAHSSDDRATFIGLVNKFDIKTAIKHFVQSGKSINKTHGFSIACRRNEVILTVRYPKGKVITHEDNMEIQQGLKEFFKKLNEVTEK